MEVSHFLFIFVAFSWLPEPEAISEIEKIYKEYTTFCNLQIGKLYTEILLYLLLF